MKKIVLALMLVLPLGAFAQSALKIGYINRNELAQAMPEYNAAMKQLEDLRLTYTTEGQKLQEEAQRKYQEYIAQQDTLDAAIRQYKESELMRLQQSIEEFGRSADTNLQNKNQELMAPIIQKMNQAISQVGDENGFTYIIDNTAGILAYTSQNAIDVMPLVKKKLGIE